MTVQEIFHYGRFCTVRDAASIFNPYSAYTTEALTWTLGWMKGRWEITTLEGRKK